MLDHNTFEPKTVHSDQFGELLEADCFVRQDYEPKDQATGLYVEGLLQELGLVNDTTRPSSLKKYTRVLSDFLMCAKTSATGYIAWPSSNDDFVGAPYSADVSRKVRDRLIGAGHLWLVQKSSKRDSLACVYAFDPSLVTPWVKFKCHGEGCPVQVRGEKALDTDTGRKVGGQRLSRKKFLPQIIQLEEQVKQINSVLAQHPLEDCHGRLFGRVYRVFNNGSLKQGGRLYGPWQTMGEEERLLCTIGGATVCEIDFKASFVSIANAVLGTGEDLGSDPYQRIHFVRRNKELREAAKRLIAAYICNAGQLRQFPKGRKIKDEITGDTYTVPFKKDYNLKGSVADYMDEIFKAFPFLRYVSECQYDFMYMESEIVVSSIHELTTQGIPAYPVHDCLLVRQDDQDIVVSILQQQMQRYLGRIIDLDVTYINDLGGKVVQMVDRPMQITDPSSPIFKNLSRTWDMDGDMSLIDDEDTFKVDRRKKIEGV